MNPRHVKAKDTDKAKVARKAERKAAHDRKQSEHTETVPAKDIVKHSKNFFATDTYKARELKFRNSALKREIARAKKRVDFRCAIVTKANNAFDKAWDIQQELEEMLAETQNTESITGDRTAEELNEEE